MLDELRRKISVDVNFVGSVVGRGEIVGNCTGMVVGALMCYGGDVLAWLHH